MQLLSLTPFNIKYHYNSYSDNLPEDKIIIDPFMDSGSTDIACKKSERDFIGIEIDENYFNLAYNLLFKPDK